MSDVAHEPPVTSAAVIIEERRFLTRVFAWMGAGLTLTGGVAWYVASIDGAVDWLDRKGWVLLALVVAQFVCVGALAVFVSRFSSRVAGAIFLLYAVLNGITFSFVFAIFTTESIARTFFITASMFAALAVWGWATKRDLTALGSIAFMALFGLILAMIVNVFWASSGLYWLTTFAGVLIFSALTAYDMQKLKALNELGNEGTDADRKEAIVGALSLYLDFINLFLFLLRIFGRAKN
jgi:FtsH-binding integral membrane protein